MIVKHKHHSARGYLAETRIAGVIARRQNKGAGRLYNERQRKVGISPITPRPLVERLLGGSMRTAGKWAETEKGVVGQRGSWFSILSEKQNNE